MNAAGSDARDVGAMLGVEVPVTPYRRNLAFAPDPAHAGELIPMSTWTPACSCAASRPAGT